MDMNPHSGVLWKKKVRFFAKIATFFSCYLYSRVHSRVQVSGFLAQKRQKKRSFEKIISKKRRFKKIISKKRKFLQGKKSVALFVFSPYKGPEKSIIWDIMIGYILYSGDFYKLKKVSHFLSFLLIRDQIIHRIYAGFWRFLQGKKVDLDNMSNWYNWDIWYCCIFRSKVF